MFDKIFRSKKKITLLQEKELLEIEVEKLKNDLRRNEGIEKCKNSLIFGREEEKKKWIETKEKLYFADKENEALKFKLKKITDFIGCDNFEKEFLLPVEKYFVETRFKAAVVILKERGNEYVQQIDKTNILNIEIDEKLKLELLEKYEKFILRNVSWDIKTYLIKGEKVSKIYQKYRKFLNILLSENIEFISELKGYDFDKILKHGYENEEKILLKELYKEYILNHTK